MITQFATGQLSISQHGLRRERRGRLVLFVSPDGRFGSIATHQDALLSGTLLEAGDALEHPLEPGRRAYVHVARGQVRANGQALNQGDGLAIEDQPVLRFEGIEAAEVLLFDLPRSTFVSD
jgi:redox-sensitive bicupin YhaK (pirin superfamily)